MSPHDKAPIGLGIITVFTVIMVLCLATFSSLTLSSATADLRLSQRNAETVSAYYAADAEASRLFIQFFESGEPRLEQLIPMTDSQSLYLSLSRGTDGAPVILAWQTVAVQGTEDIAEDNLEVWGG